MQKNTEHILNRDDVSTAILQHLDGLRGIDTHCHHLPDDQFQNMGVKFLYDHSYCNWMDDLLGLLPVLCILRLLILGNLLDRICDGVIEDRILHHKDVVRAVSQLLALLGGKEDIVSDLALEADVGDQPVTGLDVDPREVAGVGVTIGVAVRDVKEVDEVVPVFY